MLRSPRRAFILLWLTGSAPELFVVITVLNKQFIPAAIISRRAFFPAGSKSIRLLKEDGFSSPMTSH